MKFIDFFAGAGGMRHGLERAGHKCVGFCEWDKYARQSYKAVFDTEGEWENHDIRTASSMEPPKADLWSYGFPCQGISVAGKQKGIGKGAEDGEADERSNLFFQIIRLLQGLSEQDILRKERTEYGKKIRKTYENGEVQEKRANMTQYTPRTDGITNTLTTVEKDNYLLVEGGKIIKIGNYSPSGHNASTVVDPIGIAPTVMENHGTVTGVVLRKVRTEYGEQIRKEYETENELLDTTNSLDNDGLRIRKLTPKECWRLQGWCYRDADGTWNDSAFDRAKAAGVSDSQLYKQAGNGCSANITYAIGLALANTEKDVKQ